MFLQIIVRRVLLWKESGWREKNNLLEGDPFHGFHHPEAIVLREVFNDIKRDARIKLLRPKIPVKFTNITENHFIVSVELLRLVNRRFIAVNAHRMGNPQLTQCWRRAASHIQHTLASRQRSPQCHFDNNLRGIGFLFQQMECQGCRALHKITCSRSIIFPTQFTSEFARPQSKDEPSALLCR